VGNSKVPVYIAGGERFTYLGRTWEATRDSQPVPSGMFRVWARDITDPEPAPKAELVYGPMDEQRVQKNKPLRKQASCVKMHTCTEKTEVTLHVEPEPV
jgi:hypothetical protein